MPTRTDGPTRGLTPRVAGGQTSCRCKKGGKVVIDDTVVVCGLGCRSRCRSTFGCRCVWFFASGRSFSCLALFSVGVLPDAEVVCISFRVFRKFLLVGAKASRVVLIIRGASPSPGARGSRVSRRGARRLAGVGSRGSGRRGPTRGGAGRGRCCRVRVASPVTTHVSREFCALWVLWVQLGRSTDPDQ